jgi:hypothetical protein
MQAAIKPFISKSPSGGFRYCREPSKNRPTLNQWLRLIAVGRSVGGEAIGAAASINANCDCDSGGFMGDREA